MSVDGNWTLGVLVGLPALGLVFVVAVAVSTLLVVKNDEWDTGFIAWITGAPVAVCVLAVVAVGYFPYQKPYHYWEPVTGQVERVDSRLVASGDGMAERYVFTINGAPYGVDDSRASTVDVGDEVRLSCKKEWEWQAEPGWACRWVSHVSAS